MVKNKRGNQTANDLKLKPSSYQPTKEELEADLRLPASIDEVVDALFASKKELPDAIDEATC